MAKTDIQGDFLSQLQAERTPVTVVVVNGYQIKGRITAYDQYTILMDVEGQQHLVFKSAISTVREG